MQVAYACRIKRENFHAIASENPKFDLNELHVWIAAHGEGYFIRDEASPWDCSYMPDVVFQQIYVFDAWNKNELFMQIRMV